jgi:hypothetical protein
MARVLGGAGLAAALGVPGLAAALGVRGLVGQELALAERELGQGQGLGQGRALGVLAQLQAASMQFLLSRHHLLLLVLPIQ